MPNDQHREAERLAVQASKARDEGRTGEALNLYTSAASLEDAALWEVPVDKIRTRSVLSLSVASLLYKAHKLDEAEIRIFRFLSSEPPLEKWADKQLRLLLQVVSDERTIADSLGRKYSGESITVALRGGEIGIGTGPLDLVLEKAAGFRSLLYRFAEWTGKYPLRKQGNPPKAVMELIQARAMEPTVGSYRLEIKLTEPSQLEMFSTGRVKPEAISDAMFQFLDSLVRGNTSELEQLVPQPEYRRAFLELTRNIAPGGKRLSEVGIYRSSKDRVQSVYLTDAVTTKVRQALPRREFPSETRGQLAGVLRALHLDQNWLEITTPSSDHQKCDTVHDMLDDVVGPMVNREVVVSGRWRTRKGKRKLLVEEIELIEKS